MGVDDLAIAIHDYGIGQHTQAVAVVLGDGDALLVAEQDRVIDAHRIHEVFGVLLGVDGDADDGEALVLVLLLQIDEGGDLAAAGRAPGGPEVDHQDLAVPFADMAQLALQILQAEVGADLGDRIFTDGL